MNGLPMLGLLACGLAGGLLFLRFRVPLGGLVGGIVGAGLFHLLVADVPPPGRAFVVVAQLLVGSIIGASVNRPVLERMRSVLAPTLAFCLLMPVVGLALGWLLMARTGEVDLLTAFLASAPAGAMEMTTVALGIDANAEVVLTAQVLRVFTIAILGSILLPPIVRWLGPDSNGADGPVDRARP
jgi:membrane AbrB-like protein